MSSQQLDESAILEVAGEIRDAVIRGKYLDQVCHDPDLRLRLERRLKARRRWQFGLRSLLFLMVMAGVVSAFLGISIKSALRAKSEQLRALRAAEQARAAMLQLEAAQSEEKMP